ncbi:MAG: DUF6064 family protein [Methyloceanibacter sp.]|uniref:DUF6064 family protein n=1 Tax=Methyloceanibacter sp. TaxID=1965321 RepID=UPI003EDEFD56
MSEWWTYQPRDLLMFSPDTYYRLFELYNTEVWPVQLLALTAGLVILVLLYRPSPWSGRVIAALLAACWAFVAWAYFHERYATINLAAPTYALAFAAQAVLLVLVGVVLNRLSFAKRGTPLGQAGRALFPAGLVIYPLMAVVFGRPWLQSELFGIAPDPTVFCTLGVLAAADRMRWELMVVPVLWSAVTGVTLWTMGSSDAAVTGVAALYALCIAFLRVIERPEPGRPLGS